MGTEKRNDPANIVKRQYTKHDNFQRLSASGVSKRNIATTPNIRHGIQLYISQHLTQWFLNLCTLTPWEWMGGRFKARSECVFGTISSFIEIETIENFGEKTGPERPHTTGPGRQAIKASGLSLIWPIITNKPQLGKMECDLNCGGWTGPKRLRSIDNPTGLCTANERFLTSLASEQVTPDSDGNWCVFWHMVKKLQLIPRSQTAFHKKGYSQQTSLTRTR